MFDFSVSLIVFSILLPLLLLMVQIFLYRLATPNVRKGDKKLIVSYWDAQIREYSQTLHPLSVVAFKQKFKSRRETPDGAGVIQDIKDIQELPGDIWETSFGIDLGIGALLTTLSSLTIFLNRDTTTIDKNDIVLGTMVALVAELALLAFTTELVRRIQVAERRPRRVALAFLTNLCGLFNMFASVLVLSAAWKL